VSTAHPVVVGRTSLGFLLSLCGIVLYALAALALFTWLIHTSLWTALGMLASGLFLRALADVV
jgi:hypothetical protein